MVGPGLEGGVTELGYYGYGLGSDGCRSDAGRGLQPRPKRLDASITFETLNVKGGVTNPALLLASDPI